MPAINGLPLQRVAGMAMLQQPDSPLCNISYLYFRIWLWIVRKNGFTRCNLGKSRGQAHIKATSGLDQL